jgi:4-diphosphocytidyl-2-C-methyl-D-erythritol kinase
MYLRLFFLLIEIFSGIEVNFVKKIELKARAKINLSLDVLNKRSDGYHEVKMLMQTLELHDTITIKQIDNGIEVNCNSPYVPSNNQNIAYKAAEVLLKAVNIKTGVSINITKKIPVAAGLAGGSSNAAAVLKGLNEMFSLGISETELMIFGKQIGADVPYCIKGETMLSEGIGEILTKISQLTKTHIILVKPKIGVSTAWVYKNLNLLQIKERPQTELLIKAIGEKNIEYLALNMKNVLESVTVPKYPIIDEIKKKMVNEGASGSMMSGSGPTVFGIYKDIKMAEKAWDLLRTDKRCDCILTTTSEEI